MKALPLVLAGSLVVNAALVVAMVRLDSVSSAPTVSVDHRPGSAPATSARGTQSVATTAADPASGAPNDRHETDLATTRWRDLGTGSLEELVTRLRAEGCPSWLLRSIVGYRLHEDYAARQRALVAGIKEPPYWTGNRFGLDPQFMSAYRQLRQEESERMKELLGEDADREGPTGDYYRRRQFGDVSPQKAEQMQQIAQDYNELRSQIFTEANGLLMPEDRQKMAYLEKEMRGDLAQILTTTELENYELRSSSTAQTLRQQLTTFKPTEDEFRALFRAARSTEDQFGATTGVTSAEQMQQRQAAFLQAASGSLTPERLAALTQATDPRYNMINRVVARYELPTTIVPQIAAVQQDIQRRAGAIRANRSLSGADRASQMTGLAQEATATLQPLLGEKGFEAYKQYGGSWMRMLTPTPPTGVRTPPATPPPATGTAPKG
ncbi:hypothetical protein [Opitutus terrae]|uniref:Uncharacterized protein n=1 Tax=Opitutus terrae (strain DSM 11246 / JCM 15787 / PB90-1) TaxID=452637 RepID=B1ZXQ2_OPITP|nr:hypothetical protein [Opitutus terrae]ACB74274.1 hypothetical protein Oter_0986 [Opitutus terrae PB90-1]